MLISPEGSEQRATLTQLRSDVRAALKVACPSYARLERSKSRMREKELLRPKGSDPSGNTSYAPPATVAVVAPLAAHVAAWALSDAALASFEADGLTSLQLPLGGPPPQRHKRSEQFSAAQPSYPTVGGSQWWCQRLVWCTAMCHCYLVRCMAMKIIHCAPPPR